MTYSAEISRANPTCFLFLIDQSGSMADPFGTGESRRPKAQGVADAVNKLLQNLVITASKPEVRDYYSVGVIGYGAAVGPAFAGDLQPNQLNPISAIADKPAHIEERTKKVEDGAGGLVEQTVKFPIWFEPTSNGQTPMCEALALAKNILDPWASDHKTSFPPVVVHITDGESTDGDPLPAMSALKAISTEDGNALLFNLHLSGKHSGPEIAFPSSLEAHLDQYAHTLFEGASRLTPFMLSVAKEHGISVADDARGFVLNSSLELVIQAIDIGTRPAALR